MSAVTASMTAAMSSGSGGSGMYSFAPAWMAATAAFASVPVPQATTGVRIRSAARASTRRPIGWATSIMIRSAPLARRTTSPWSTASACVTLRAALHRDPGGGDQFAVQPPDDE